MHARLIFGSLQITCGNFNFIIYNMVFFLLSLSSSPHLHILMLLYILSSCFQRSYMYVMFIYVVPYILIVYKHKLPTCLLIVMGCNVLCADYHVALCLVICSIILAYNCCWNSVSVALSWIWHTAHTVHMNWKGICITKWEWEKSKHEKKGTADEEKVASFVFSRPFYPSSTSHLSLSLSGFGSLRLLPSLFFTYLY